MLITSKYQSWCNRCGRVEIRVGDRCEWTKAVRGVTCLACLGANPPSAPPPSSFKAGAKAREETKPREVAAPVLLPPAVAALDALEVQFVRMAAKNATPALDAAWNKYEKVKALAFGSRVKPEQRVALKTALVLLVTAIFSEESAYVV